MIILDAHCDTITKIMETGEGLKSNKCHLDIERMKLAGNYVQFFAAFIDPSYCQAYSLKRAIQIIDRFYEEINKNSDEIMLCLNHNDIIEAVKNKKIGAILSIEGGEALQGELSSLRMFYKLGVRSICLTWNHRNEIADGVSDRDSGGGLTPYGKKLISEMNRIGMMIDLSHISERGFWDVMDITKKPVIVSHSNAKSLCSHVRNLNDEQIKAVKQNGGVIGINFYSDFLSNNNTANIDDIISHIEYIVSLIGYENVGFGSDFDGVESLPEGINGVEDMYKIIDGLKKLNYTQEAIECIAGGNFLRVMGVLHENNIFF